MYCVNNNKYILKTDFQFVFFFNYSSLKASLLSFPCKNIVFVNFLLGLRSQSHSQEMFLFHLKLLPCCDRFFIRPGSNARFSLRSQSLQTF